MDRVTTEGRALTMPDDTPARADALAELPDAVLVTRLQAGDLDAFEALFRRHRALIHRTAYGLTGDAQVAEEVLQDTFVRAYRHRATLRTDVSPAPWLHRVALNLCYSRLARRRLPVDPIDDAAAGLRDHRPGPDAHAELAELRSVIRAGVADLPPKHRSVVVLYYLHGLSLAETADFLGVRLGTVKSRLHYALKGLRHRLAEPDGSGGSAVGVETAAGALVPRGDGR